MNTSETECDSDTGDAVWHYGEANTLLNILRRSSVISVNLCDMDSP